MFKLKKRIMIFMIMFAMICLNFQLVQGQEVDIRISGASTIQPILEEIAPLYLEETGQIVEISAGGSGTGVSDAIAGNTELGAVSRSLTAAESEELNNTTIGVDALVLIVNQANPLAEINKEQLIEIYTEGVNNWQQFTDFDQEILLVSKMTGRSTLDLFEDYSGLLSPRREESGEAGIISDNAYEIGSNLEMITMVAGIPNAIGYVSLGAALSLQEMGAAIKILTLDGIEPSQPNIAGGIYPIGRELNLVYTELTATKSDFLDFVLSEAGQATIEEAGFIPVN